VTLHSRFRSCDGLSWLAFLVNLCQWLLHDRLKWFGVLFGLYDRLHRFLFNKGLNWFLLWNILNDRLHSLRLRDRLDRLLLSSLLRLLHYWLNQFLLRLNNRLALLLHKGLFLTRLYGLLDNC